MQAVLWRDYLCPWCYLALDRTALLESLGVRVTSRSYDLHPELATTGRPVRAGGRLAEVLDHIGAECADVGLPFRAPSRIANTRLALETAEIVRGDRPGAFPAVDAAFYRAQWVDDLDLGDPDVVDGILAAAGLDPVLVAAAREAGAGARALDRSMAEAREREVTGTPAWWIDDRLLVPGVQAPETLERWVRRLREHSVDAPNGDPADR